MAQSVQQDFALLLQSYKKIKKMSKEIGTATDNTSLRGKLKKELDSAETITSRMMADITHIDNRTKREKLQTQLSKTRKEIETLRKDIEKQQRLNSVKQSNPFLGRDSSGGGGAWGNSNPERPVDQSLKFQSFHGEQRAAEEREAEIYQIQKDTEQIAEVFQDLLEMVEDQGQDVDNLEATCEQIAERVEMGGQELDKAAEYQKAKRKKKCMLVICLIVLGAILAGILAWGNN